eukprot:405388_1
MRAKKRKHTTINNQTDTHSTNSGPPTKKQRTHPTEPAVKLKKKGNLRMFFQFSNLTEKQITNILRNTRKGSERPLILFADNDDQFFQRVVCNRGEVTERKSSDDLWDTNAKLLHKYENWFCDKFLSFGIITDFKDCAMYEEEDKFKVNVDSNFRTLRNVVDTLKIKEIIIPCSNSNTDVDASPYIFSGPHLSAHHLQYIQHKFDEFKALYIKQFIFIEHAVQYGDHDLDITSIRKHQTKNDNAAKQTEPNTPHMIPSQQQDQVADHTRLLMQRVEQQSAVIMHQQKELRLARQVMDKYGMKRMALRGHHHKTWKRLNIASSVISTLCFVLTVLLMTVLNWNVLLPLFWSMVLVASCYLCFKKNKPILLCSVYSILFIVCVITSCFVWPRLAHMIDMNASGDTLVYVCGAFAWCIIMALVSQRISGRPLQAFITMSIGPPCMFGTMYCVSRVVLEMYFSTLSNEERLAILWWFICVFLVPIVVIAVFIGYIIQLASHSQLKSVVNWKSFGQLVLSVVVLYVMISMHHFDLSMYAFVMFGVLYMIVQCFIVSRSRVQHGNNKTPAGQHSYGIIMSMM